MTRCGNRPKTLIHVIFLCSAVKVNPVDGDRLWIVFEQALGQVHLEVAVCKRKGLVWFPVLANPLNLHPVRMFRGQFRGLASVFP